MSTTPETRSQSRPAEAVAMNESPVALIQLVTTVVLALSTLIAATAVSIGIACAHMGKPTVAAHTLSTSSFSATPHRQR
jgi:hypothetical protein